MPGKRPRGLDRVESDFASVRSVLPVPFPTDVLPVKRNQQVIPAPTKASTPEMDGLYIISVAARLLEMHPQTLRKYEKVGLVRPSRTMGMLRLYSQQDITRLRLIKHLVDDLGMNLAGVEFVLGLFHRLRDAHKRVEALEEEKSLKELVGQEFDLLLEMMDITFAGLQDS